MMDNHIRWCPCLLGCWWDLLWTNRPLVKTTWVLEFLFGFFYEMFLFKQARGGIGVLLPENLFSGAAALQVLPV